LLCCRFCRRRLFGKTDNTAIDLSAIASGTGSCVINGERAGDWSGISVSTAGDVNGDGLDDLIVGAHGTKPSGKETAGKSYVVFGKNDSTAIDLSAIASGTGGFVINGESAGDWSGISVSTAGDVNGVVSWAPTIKSSKPSPLTSPAVETAKKTAQQLTFLLLPVAQGALSLR
jgi:hypothetical protein